MILMAWRGLRSRWIPTLASLLAVMLGAGLGTAALLIQESATSAAARGELSAWHLHATDMVVRLAPEVRTTGGLSHELREQRRLSPEQLNALNGVRGVESVAGETAFPAFVLAGDRMLGDSRTRSWGHSWSLARAEPANLVRGEPPRGPNDLAVDSRVASEAGLHLGETVQVVTSGGRHEHRLTGIVERQGEGFEHALFFAPATAVRLGGQAMVAFVSPRPGVDPADLAKRIQATLPEAEVLWGEEKGRGLTLDPRAQLSGGMGQFLGTMAAVCLVIAAFVISSTLSVSVSQRRRELALLRAVGASSGRVRALVVGEAVLVGGLAGVAGALGGVGLASAGLRFFANQGLIPRSLPLTPDPTSFLAGAGVAVVTAAVAGTLPAWRASRIEPGEALRAAELPPRRTGAGRRLWGLVSLAAGVGLLLVSMAVAAPVNTPRGAIAVSTLFVSVPFLLLAVALLGPVLIRGVVGVVAGPLRTCFGGFMASRSVQADLRRAAGVAVPITVMVATASILLFQDSTTFVAKSRNYGQRLEADLVVAGPHQVGVPSVISDRLAGVPGVRAASGVVSTQIFVVGQNDEASYAEAMGVSPNAISQVLRLPVVSGSWSAFTEGTLAVSQETATTQGWSAGGNINYRLPDGTPATGRVAVVYESDATFANVLLPRSELLPHLREPFDTAVYMTLASGVDRATVERELRRVIHPVPGLVLTSRSEHLEQMAAQSTGDNWIVSLFVVLIGGYAGISAINVLVGSTNGQRRQFALLRLAGARRGHVLSWVTVEAAVSVVTGILWGSLISGAVMCGYARLLTGTFWVPLPLAPYLLICCAAVAVGMVGSLVPARLAMRARPLEAMSTT